MAGATRPKRCALQNWLLVLWEKRINFATCFGSGVCPHFILALFHFLHLFFSISLFFHFPGTNDTADQRRGMMQFRAIFLFGLLLDIFCGKTLVFVRDYTELGHCLLIPVLFTLPFLFFGEGGKRLFFLDFLLIYSSLFLWLYNKTPRNPHLSHWRAFSIGFKTKTSGNKISAPFTVSFVLCRRIYMKGRLLKQSRTSFEFQGTSGAAIDR